MCQWLGGRREARKEGREVSNERGRSAASRLPLLTLFQSLEGNRRTECSAGSDTAVASTRYSLLATRYSLLATRYSLLATRYSLLTHLPSLLASQPERKEEREGLGRVRTRPASTRSSLLCPRFSLQSVIGWLRVVQSGGAGHCGAWLPSSTRRRSRTSICGARAWTRSSA